MTESSQQHPDLKWRWFRALANALVCLAILSAAVAAVVVIYRTEPTAEKINATRKSSALVETMTAKRGTFAPRLVVLGTVQSAQQISLSPRVSGQVIELSPKFIPGGMIKANDLLLRIDPADFENSLSISQSELAQAEASMEIEQARQRLAEKELKLLEGSIDETNRGLVMREPQIASMKAEVAAAEAAVERAQLNLDRANVYAPFDAQVQTRTVNVGSQVSPGDELGELIGLDEYWIIAAVPVRSLRWIQFPKIDQPSELKLSTELDQAAAPSSSKTPGSSVILRNRDAWGPGVEREARVSRLIGTLDQQTRLARVLITVDDPLGQKSEDPPLILQTMIETEIEGRPIDDVVRLPREYVRDRDTVWVMNDDQLEIRKTEIEFRDAKYAYIRSGLENGDEVVTSTLATVAEGVGLRKTSDTPSSPEDGE